MTPALEERVLWWTVRLSGCVVSVLVALLIFDGLAERRRAASEVEQIDSLEETVLTDSSVAAQLAEERELQTKRSVTRQDRNKRFAWALLVASGLFLSAFKRKQALGLDTAGRRETDELVQLGLGTSVGSLLAPSGRVRSGSQELLGLGFVDEVVARCGTSREATIPILQAVQSHYRYLPEAALHRMCELTDTTPAEVVGVASFYAQFRQAPVGEHLVRICHGTACHVAGVEPIIDELLRRLEIPEDEDSDQDRRFTLDPVNCLGCCSLAPVMMIDDEVAGRLTPTSACQALAAAEVDS